uniref:Uncharacterized protein n=1 Tax=Parascaris univalens TaxID=6257 RepID=A0A914ZU73_PARUN
QIFMFRSFAYPRSLSYSKILLAGIERITTHSLSWQIFTATERSGDRVRHARNVSTLESIDGKVPTVKHCSSHKGIFISES